MNRPDGTAVCDRCGADAGNGGISYAITAQDYRPESGQVFVYHFGRACGCAEAILTPATLEHRSEVGETVGAATEPPEPEPEPQEGDDAVSE